MQSKFKTLLLAGALLVSGCMTTAAIIESPKLLSLEPEPPRYFQMSLEVDIKGEKKNIEYTWKCEQTKAFSASTMDWKLEWDSKPRYVVQKLRGGPTVFFVQPKAAYCSQDGEVDYFPGFGVIPDQQSLTRVDVYRGKIGGGKYYSEAVLKGKIRRVQGAVNTTTSSKEEIALAEQLQDQSRNFLARSVRIYPESIWGKYSETKRYYNNISVITKASAVYPPERKKMIDRSGLYYFPVRVLGFMKDEDHRNMLNFNVQIRDGEITFDKNDIPQEWTTFRNEGYGSRDRDVKFCYFGRCFDLSGIANEIYDPVTRNVISINSVSTLSTVLPR